MGLLGLVVVIFYSFIGGAIVALEAGQAGSPNEKRQDAYERGMAAYTRGDYLVAMREWLPLAQQGYAAAQTNLGVMYANGLGVARDKAQAVGWYRKAAEQGHVGAQFELAEWYSQDPRITRWWRKAAEQGYAPAQDVLGMRYAEGFGVTQDGAEAMRWLRKAAEQGEDGAQSALGFRYAQGRGVTQDAAEAARWFQKAEQAKASRTAQDNVPSWSKYAVQTSQRWAQQLAQEYNPAPLPTPESPSPPRVLPKPPSSAAVLPRSALVIGNASYPDKPLIGPVNNATDMAALLRRRGFIVTLLHNGNKATMERAIEAFTSSVPQGAVGLFYFAGHGVQIDGLNYLLPSGERFREPSDVKYRAVQADWVLARMDDAKMAVKLLILDACRDNPFGRSWTRSLSRGLAHMDAVEGSLIAYATSPGKTALDGEGRNSPYTAQLLRHLPTPGLPVELVFKAVREGVQRETRRQCGADACKQTPWEATSLTGHFYFVRQ
jgi:Caspase domain/Sel1 repeat